MNTRFVGTKLFMLAALIGVQCATSAWAQDKKPVALATLATYTGPDREQRLLDGGADLR